MTTYTYSKPDIYSKFKDCYAHTTEKGNKPKETLIDHLNYNH
jgi:hypothetical protein